MPRTRTERIIDDVEACNEIMSANIEKVMDRGEKISQLRNKCGAQSFCLMKGLMLDEGY